MVKRICLVVPSFETGGVEKAVTEIASNMSMVENVEVHLVVFGMIPEVFHPVPEKVTVHLAPFVFDPGRQLENTIRTMRFFRRTIREIDPSSTLCFGEKWSFLLMISLSGLSYRVFVSERFEPWKPVWPNRWIKRFVMQRAEGVIVQSQSTRELYHALFPEKSIYKIRDPFVQRDIFHAVKKENVVLAVGPLGPNNRLDELIRQFRNHRNPGWKLVITGGDSFFQHYLDKLNETIRELQAEEYVILAGSRLDMNYYYGISKIFAHVSTSAVPSYAMGEAMSAGIPVVGFNLENGDDSIVEHGASGLLAPRGDFHTIGYFLRQLMDYPGLCNKMGTYAQQRMLQFKPMDIGESYYKCLVLDKSMAS